MRNIRRVRLKHKTENETHQDRTPKGNGKGPRLKPEEILTKKALAKPHRTVVTASVEPNCSQKHIDALMKAL